MSSQSYSATVPFRKEISKALTYKKPANGHADAADGSAPEVDETTPLNPSGNGSADSGEHSRSFLYRLLWEKKSTPGEDSNNVIVNPVNILLVFVPLGIIAGLGNWGATAVFTLNFFAIIPLAAVLSFATEVISEKVGQAMGGLLNATFGNAVELIVSIVALKEGQISVVQSSMLGSILSNLLLVMGMCFVLGGLYNMRDSEGRGMEQSFASVTAQTSCSLMALAATCLIIPATLYSVLDEANEGDKEASILILSRGTAIIMLLLYVTYLWFQLRTHHNLFDPEQTNSDDDESDGQEEIMSAWSAAGVLVAVTLVIAVCAEYLVDSIDAIVATGAISKNFIGLILIPIVGNAAEHVTACVVAVRNKMDLAMSVAVGSSIQIALLVTPFLVIIGWPMGQPMSLHFETFETIAFALSVLVVTYTIQDGKSNYLEGAMLMGLYIIIALAFYAAPSDALDKVLKIFSTSS